MLGYFWHAISPKAALSVSLPRGSKCPPHHSFFYPSMHSRSQSKGIDDSQATVEYLSVLHVLGIHCVAAGMNG